MYFTGKESAPRLEQSVSNMDTVSPDSTAQDKPDEPSTLGGIRDAPVEPSTPGGIRNAPEETSTDTAPKEPPTVRDVGERLKEPPIVRKRKESGQKPREPSTLRGTRGSVSATGQSEASAEQDGQDGCREGSPGEQLTSGRRRSGSSTGSVDSEASEGTRRKRKASSDNSTHKCSNLRLISTTGTSI